VSFRALKDRMMYGLDDDSVDVFSFLIFLFWGVEILVLDFRALGRQDGGKFWLVTRQAGLLWSLAFAIFFFMSYFLSVQRAA
jgi:hypothetical protein